MGVGVGGGTERTGAATTMERAGRRATTREVADAWESLFRTQVTVLRRLQDDDIWDEVSLREYDVLFALSGAPGLTLRQRDLQEASLLSQPSLSRLVDRLVAAGLVERRPVPGDGRGVGVHLTDEGLKVQRAVGRRHVRSIERLLGGTLDADELAALRVLLDRLRHGAATTPPERP
ncbi:MarR family winged helix-turn-helix transcriptional regulator [Cellulomonas sp. SG140]|uniref:MarR family winged helix-turn-helix transcriptional regulator n=1 Tax=Cellulomonas sp. SG140 TaxID=2976536 RepID=UPI002987FDDA|nr:MarR family winged helix-turn-helix transcriptional regulator [Cellulomonas sp. SG140]